MLQKHSVSIKPVRSNCIEEQAEDLKKKLAALPNKIKEFYNKHPQVSVMSDQEVKDFRISKNNIIVKSSTIII